jgi:hypothetical protein
MCQSQVLLHVSSYYYMCVLILRYVCPHTTMYVSSYGYMCVKLLYVCLDGGTCDMSAIFLIFFHATLQTLAVALLRTDTHTCSKARRMRRMRGG